MAAATATTMIAVPIDQPASVKREVPATVDVFGPNPGGGGNVLALRVRSGREVLGGRVCVGIVVDRCVVEEPEQILGVAPGHEHGQAARHGPGRALTAG